MSRWYILEFLRGGRWWTYASWDEHHEINEQRDKLLVRAAEKSDYGRSRLVLVTQTETVLVENFNGGCNVRG